MFAKHQPWETNFNSNSDVFADVEWNMWRVRQAPFSDVEEGMEIVYVSGGGPANGRLMYTATMEGLVAAEYHSKAHAWDLMLGSIGETRLLEGGVNRDWFFASEYTQAAPETGWLLAWTGIPLRQIDAPRPEGMRFRPNGWCEVSDAYVDAAWTEGGEALFVEE